MRIKVFQVICFYLSFAIGNALTYEEGNQKFITKWDLILRTLFPDSCILKNIPSDKNYCALFPKGDIFEFQCSDSLFNDKVTTIAGSCTSDPDFLQMLRHYSKNSHMLLRLQDCRNINISSFEIFKGDTECLNYIASHLPNLKEITWILNECVPVNSFLQRMTHLRKLRVLIRNDNHLLNCQDHCFSNLTQIKDLQIEFKNSFLETTSVYAFLNKMFLRGMENLEVFSLKSLDYLYLETREVKIPKEMFQGLTNLSSITFIDSTITNLAKEHFQDLVNLRSLQFTRPLGNDFDWLNSTIIQDMLNFLELHKDQHIPKTNISAFICRDPSICQFNVDINKKSCPEGFKCYLNRTELRFKIECDESKTCMDIPELPIPITGNASLYFGNKNLTQLPSSTLYGYPKIRELHLANNKLKSIIVEQLPVNLNYLDLRNNSLQYFDDDVVEILSRRAGQITMKLSENPWKCDCEVLKMLQFFVDKANDIGDRNHLKCRGQIIDLPFVLRKTDECRTNFNTLSGLLLGLVVLILIFFYFKKSISMWLYERNLCLRFLTRPEPQVDIDLKIDGFLAFSHVDLELVGEYVEKLERGPREYRLCFYQRDWLVGESIPACILQSINDSKRVIILMTNNFINSSWGLFELRSAIRAASMDKDKRLIVILYPDVDLDKLDSELKLYMKFNTYLRRDDPQFWRKLMFAMPHKQIQCEQPAITGDPAIEEEQV